MSRGCEDDLSVTESRIKASANFFGPSCKPGPWVSDPLQDALLSEMKNKTEKNAVTRNGHTIEINSFSFIACDRTKVSIVV